MAIPGVQDNGIGLIVAHLCSFRGAGGQLADRVLVAGLEDLPKPGRSASKTRFLNRTPVPDLEGERFWAARLDLVGRALTSDLPDGERIVCLSVGVNMLQQRLTCHLTRVDVATADFNTALAHTFDEADLLEEWADTLGDAGWTQPAAAAEFETFVR